MTRLQNLQRSEVINESRTDRPNWRICYLSSRALLALALHLLGCSLTKYAHVLCVIVINFSESLKGEWKYKVMRLSPWQQMEVGDQPNTPAVLLPRKEFPVPSGPQSQHERGQKYPAVLLPRKELPVPSGPQRQHRWGQNYLFYSKEKSFRYSVDLKANLDKNTSIAAHKPTFSSPCQLL